MDRSRIPNRLKKYRRLADLSQKEVATMLGLKNTSCIFRWEKGLGFPGIIHLFQLSFLYKTIPDHLYFEVYESVKQN
jgi:transcriptional regulator with XRE-family HTH domain